MSNKRINELPTISTVSPTDDYLIVDPSSGGTSKISIENAVTQSNWAQAGATAGAPKIAMNSQLFTKWVVTDLFATSSTAFGTMSVHKTGGKYKGLVAWFTYTISKEAGSSLVNVLAQADRGKSHGISMSGDRGMNPALALQVEPWAGNPTGKKHGQNIPGPIYIYKNGIYASRGFYTNFMYWTVS